MHQIHLDLLLLDHIQFDYIQTEEIDWPNVSYGLREVDIPDSVGKTNRDL